MVMQYNTNIILLFVYAKCHLCSCKMYGWNWRNCLNELNCLLNVTSGCKIFHFCRYCLLGFRRSTDELALLPAFCRYPVLHIVIPFLIRIFMKIRKGNVDVAGEEACLAVMLTLSTRSGRSSMDCFNKKSCIETDIEYIFQHFVYLISRGNLKLK